MLAGFLSVGPTASAEWRDIEVSKLSAKGGAEIRLDADDSIRGRLVRPETSVYRIEAPAGIPRLAGLKLIVLPDPALPANGPGLAINGNFILAEVRMEIVATDGRVTPVKLASAYADYEQNGWYVSLALRGEDPEKGWAIYEGIGRAHEAFFAPKSPVEVPAGSHLVIELRNGTKAFPDHQIGRLRLQVTADGRDFAPGDHSPLRKIVLDESPRDPFELAVAADGRVFYIERLGAIKECEPATRSSRLVGRLEVFSQLDDGLLGLTLDPEFLTNGWMYLCYSAPVASQNLVARFTVRDGTLDRASEKVLLHIPVQRKTPPCHTGGSLAFDGQGNLFISTGDNTNPFESQGFSPVDERPDRSAWDAQASAGNSLDLRGKILRITPQPDGTYTVPAGNLFAPADPLARPEIYAMGCRNPFRMSVDRRTGTVYWGDVGPDAPTFDPARGPAGYDEINRARTAGNFGWPFFVADNKPYRRFDFATGASGPFWDAADVRNDSPHNTGRAALPAAQPAFIWYPYAASAEFPEMGSGGRCVMAGPVYHFDPVLASPRKLPADFDRHLFIYDWMRSRIYAVGLDAGERRTTISRILAGTSLRRPMDLELGPDGALYLIEWGTAYDGGNADAKISRIEARPPDESEPPSAELPDTKASPHFAPEDYRAALAAGDAAAGSALFHNTNKVSCLSCHRLQNEGGVTGPPLDGGGARLTANEILESILFPARRIAPGYGLLTVTLKDGSLLAGTLKREDDVSLELETPERGRITIAKSTVSRRGELITAMPEVAATMTPREVADLVAFLSTLRTPPAGPGLP